MALLQSGSLFLVPGREPGVHKRRLRPDDLLARFEAVRRGEPVDESAAAMIGALYV
jgi:hypothetical protein